MQFPAKVKIVNTAGRVVQHGAFLIQPFEC